MIAAFTSFQPDSSIRFSTVLIFPSTCHCCQWFAIAPREQSITLCGLGCNDDQSLGVVSVDPLYQFSIYALIPKPILTADQRIHLPKALVEMAVKVSKNARRVLVHLVECTHEQFRATRRVEEIIHQRNAHTTFRTKPKPIYRSMQFADANALVSLKLAGFPISDILEGCPKPSQYLTFFLLRACSKS